MFLGLLLNLVYSMDSGFPSPKSGLLGIKIEKIKLYPEVRSKIALARSPLASSKAVFAFSLSTPACWLTN